MSNAAKIQSEPGLQARKSHNTRVTILKATLKCIVKYGYHDTTDLKISQLSGLSRGAMRHHFPSRKDIIHAAIDYLHERRLNAFKTSLSDLDLHPSDRVRFAVESFDELVNKPMYRAFSELASAARRDPELKKILSKKRQNFEAEYMRMGTEIFPEWKDKPLAYDLVMHLTRYILEGIANDYIPPSPHVRSLLLDNLETQITSILERASEIDG